MKQPNTHALMRSEPGKHVTQVLRRAPSNKAKRFDVHKDPAGKLISSSKLGGVFVTAEFKP